MRSTLGKFTIGLGIVSITAAAVGAPAAQDSPAWNQWRGPNRDGVGDAAALPAQLPAELTEAWRVPVGEGYAGPLVIGDRVYVFGRQDGREISRALALADGSEIWSSAYEAPFQVAPAARNHGPGPKSTPVHADGRLFTFGISGVLSAHDAASGGLLWRHDFDGDFPQAWPIWGHSMSPIVIGDRLIAHVGGDRGGAMRAFDVASGEVVWSNDEFTPGYASPIIVDIGGAEVLVTQSNEHIIALGAADGTTLWSMPFATSSWQNAVTPLAAGPQLVLSGLDLDLFSVRLAANGDGLEAAEAWRNNRVPLYMSAPVRVGDRVFGMSHRRRGQFICVDLATGEQIWATEGRAGENAVLTVLGDRIAILTDDAMLTVIDAGADEYTPLAAWEVAPSATWAPPAFTRAGVLIKDHETLALWGYE